jgi:DNA-binding NarL/FixJ family response regulator
VGTESAGHCKELPTNVNPLPSAVGPALGADFGSAISCVGSTQSPALLVTVRCLLDLNLPDRDGFSVLVDLRSHYGTISCVVLSASQDRGSIVKAMDLGVLGFIPKSSPREVMVNALRLIFSGGIYIPPEALPRGESAKPPAAACPSSPADLGLTVRQVEVLALMMQGKSNKAISRILDVAEPTVKHHVSAILKALKVMSRTEAVIAVGGFGWELPRIGDP